MDRRDISGPDFSGLLQDPGRIAPDDVLNFRRNVFGDGIVSRAEAEAVFALNAAISETCDEWTEFFLESLTDHIVHQVEPRGYVTVDNAKWLIGQVTHDGHVEAATELELLTRVLSKSRSSPEILVGFVLEEIGRAVLEGEGPLACGRNLTPGVLGEPEIELIRQVLFAFGGEAGLSVSRTEAEFLFLLNESTDAERNHPAWRELYVKAVANYLLAATTYRAPSRDQAIAREEWLSDTSIDIGGSLSRTFSEFGGMFSKGFFSGLFESSHEQIERAWKERNERQALAEAEAERVTATEAQWIIDKLTEDGIVDPNESALLQHLHLESPEIDPRLREVIDREAG